MEGGKSKSIRGMGHGDKVMGAGLLKFLQKRPVPCLLNVKKKRKRQVIMHEVNRLVGLD